MKEVLENRAALFEETTMKRRSPQKKSSSRNTALEAASIQNSLSRTQTLLQNELSRVSQVASAIDEDGKVLEETMNTHHSLDVRKAKKALTSLQRAQRREQRVLMASIFFFWSVVFYILWVRILLHIPYVDRLVSAVRFW
jgi:hypothetical protein